MLLQTFSLITKTALSLLKPEKWSFYDVTWGDAYQFKITLCKTLLHLFVWRRQSRTAVEDTVDVTVASLLGVHRHGDRERDRESCSVSRFP